MKCKHCGEEIPNDSKFCEFCGTQIKKKSKLPWWAILLIVIGCSIVIGLGVLIGISLLGVSTADNGVEIAPVETIESESMDDNNVERTVKQAAEAYQDQENEESSQNSNQQQNQDDSFENTQLETNSPVRYAEKMPEYIGGMEALYTFLSNNLVYPEVARRKGIEGSVLIEFVVEKDGSISNVKALTSLSPECDAEAIRVIKKLPKWKPGEQMGKPVRVYYNIPIRFTLQ